MFSCVTVQRTPRAITQGSSARLMLARGSPSVTRTGQDRRLSWGFGSLQRLPAVLRYPELASLRTMPLRRCDGSGADRCEPDSPAQCHPLVLAVFRLTSRTLASHWCVHRRDCHIRPCVARRERHSPAHSVLCPAFQSSRRGFAPPGRLEFRYSQAGNAPGIPALRSFVPAGQFRERHPPRRPTCRLIRHIPLD